LPGTRRHGREKSGDDDHVSRLPRFVAHGGTPSIVLPPAAAVPEIDRRGARTYI
jgi:hypothetical protein